MRCFLDFDLLEREGWLCVPQRLESLDDFELYVQWFDSFLYVNDKFVRKADESLLLHLFINLAGEFFSDYVFQFNVIFSSYKELINFVRNRNDSQEMHSVDEEEFFLKDLSVVENEFMEYFEVDFRVEEEVFFSSVLSRKHFEFSESYKCIEFEKLEGEFEDECTEYCEVDFKVEKKVFFSSVVSIKYFQLSEINKCVECEYEEQFENEFLLKFSLVPIKFQNFFVVRRAFFYFKRGEHVGNILILFSGKFVILKNFMQQFLIFVIYFSNRKYVFYFCFEKISSHISNYKYRRKVFKEIGRL